MTLLASLVVTHLDASLCSISWDLFMCASRVFLQFVCAVCGKVTMFSTAFLACLASEQVNSVSLSAFFVCAFSVWFLSSFFNVKFSPQSWQPEKWFGEASRQKCQTCGGCYATFEVWRSIKNIEFVTNFTVFMIDSLGLDASSYHFCCAILSHKHSNFLTICFQVLHASLNHCL